VDSRKAKVAAEPVAPQKARAEIASREQRQACLDDLREKLSLDLARKNVARGVPAGPPVYGPEDGLFPDFDELQGVEASVRKMTLEPLEEEEEEEENVVNEDLEDGEIKE